MKVLKLNTTTYVAATYHQAVVITAAGNSSTQRGGGIDKSLGWENVVSPSSQVTVIVNTTNKHVHISFYGTTIDFAKECVCLLKTHYVQTLCYLCGFCPLTCPLTSTLI